MWLPKHDTAFLPAVKEGETTNAADGSTGTTALTMAYLRLRRGIVFDGCVAAILSACNTTLLECRCRARRACQMYTISSVMLQRRAHEFKIYSNDCSILQSWFKSKTCPPCSRRGTVRSNLDSAALAGHTDGAIGQPGNPFTIFARTYRYVRLHISTEIRRSSITGQTV